MENNSVLKPGHKIRPDLDHNKVTELARELYGLDVAEVKELNSYDDKNFWIRVVHSNTSNLEEVSSDGYVLKVLNSLDSKYTDAVEAQNEMILLVHDSGVPTPRPLKNKSNQYLSVVELQASGADFKSKYIVRVFEYYPGQILYGAPYTTKLMYDIGKMAGQIDNVCKDFRPSVYETYKRIWSLTEVPKLDQFLDYVTDPVKRKLAEDVIQTFKEQVVPVYNTLQRGVIHGDLNEQNILIRKCEGKEDFQLSAILDFGDSTTSYYVFEVGILLAYMMLEANITSAFETAAHALAGYLSVFDLHQGDLSVLRESVAGRLAQSLVMGNYSVAQDPDNSDYLLITADKTWTVLQLLWTTPKSDLYRQFENVLQQYNLSMKLDMLKT
ncbi:hypothetical protein FSP39_018921 [Pinctada imbricata]|uniref:Hydroxylysine kinase n=1 Tax=Pinctada imbricata TaxID=66713 RepID=A0AA89BV87_PINIB|nr:hypothetical protein FSP39_018921 [Pinctada imbricata]